MKTQMYANRICLLQRQTLDHDSLATVFLGHFWYRASLNCFILPHTQQNQCTRHAYTRITFTQMSWQRRSRESNGVFKDIKADGWSEKIGTQRKEKQTVP